MGSSGTLNAGSYSTSGCRIDFGAGGAPSTIQIKVLAVNSSADYPHNIRLIADNGRDVGLVNAGQIFRPEILTLLSYASALRTLDTQSGANNGGYITTVNWADRKPQTYYSYTQYYFPPSKVVPAANITYDGSSKYTVTWSGQNGALADKTQFIASVPSAAAGASTTNLNSTGDITNAGRDGGTRSSLGATRWALWTYDKLLNAWLIDDFGTTSNTGISAGCPIEVIVALANTVNVAPWFVMGMFWGDSNGSATDFPTQLATYVKNNLNAGLRPIFECGPNETWNPSFVQTSYAQNMQLARNGGSSAYTITAATSGATTTLTIGTNTTQVGSLLTLAGMTGLSPTSGTVRVLSKPNSTQVVVNLTSTGSSSTGTATPVAFDTHNWYGLVAANCGSAIAAVYGIGNKGSTYRAVGAFQAFGGVSAVNANAGTAARITSPFVTTNGGNAAYTYLSHISAANYIFPSYIASNSNMTIVEGRLAFEYTSATSARQTAILSEYADSTFDLCEPVNIIGIAVGNPTVITVDDTKRFRVIDGETVTITGVTGNIGTVLNRGAYSASSLSYGAPTFTAASKTATTVTVNVDTTGKTYSGGGTMSVSGSLNIGASNVYTNVLPQFLLYTSTYGLGFMAYEGGQAPDLMTADSTATIKGVTLGTTTIIIVGANSWDYLYNMVGLSGMTTTISGIAAGTLATLLNGNTYTILSATTTTITINVDSTGKSAWVSGGTASCVGSQTAVNVLRNSVNFTPEAHMVTQKSYTLFNAVDASFIAPSEYTMVGGNYGMFNPDTYATSTAYRYSGMKNRFLNKRRFKVTT
jgi:hypothetical protein